jgi:NADH-quinone oxidoreductase subunit C
VSQRKPSDSKSAAASSPNGQRQDASSGDGSNGTSTPRSWEAAISARIGSRSRIESFRGDVRLVVQAADLFETLRTLRREFGFDMLVDVTAIDLLEYPDATDRFAVVYSLLSIDRNERLIVKTFVNDPDPTLPSAVSIWGGANWLEREVYDMFGISFEGHPDLRRILMPEGFVAYPLRKDYPLQGRGERHNFPVIPRSES